VPLLLNVTQLKKLFPATDTVVLQKFVEPLNQTIQLYDIDTVDRLAAFLSQIGHESGGFMFTKENLNYSADSLRRVFGKYFPNTVIANVYARNPQKIGNRVYANRMGNGTEDSGDGYKFRGRGLIQITGKNNYTAMAEDFSMTVDELIEYLETDEGACLSAGWFWDTNGLNVIADKQDIVSLSKAVNGGTKGLAERITLYKNAKVVLA